jgi:hypothetical protein
MSPAGLLLVAAHGLLTNGHTAGLPDGRWSVQGVKEGRVIVNLLDDEGHVLWEGEGTIMDHESDGAVLVFADDCGRYRDRAGQAAQLRLLATALGIPVVEVMEPS